MEDHAELHRLLDALNARVTHLEERLASLAELEERVDSIDEDLGAVQRKLEVDEAELKDVEK